MAVLAITNNLVYNVETIADMEALGSDNGITANTVAWVEDTNNWFWPATISASTSTWACGDLAGIQSFAFSTNSTQGWAAGFYEFASPDNDFGAGVNFGTANVARAAHAFIVTGVSPPGNVTITVTGTSITDAGVNTPADVESIFVPAATAVDSYFETAKKWNGLVNIIVTLGTPFLCNYGWAKYNDVNNSDFVVLGFEFLWESDATDSTSDIEFRHHSATGWTYNPGAAVTPPAAVATRSTDYGLDNDQQVGPGAWKRDNLALAINGADSEGYLIEVTSGTIGTGSLSFRDMTCGIAIRMS